MHLKLITTNLSW